MSEPVNLHFSKQYQKDEFIKWMQSNGVEFPSKGFAR